MNRAGGALLSIGLIERRTINRLVPIMGGVALILTICCAANVAFAGGASNLNMGHIRMNNFFLNDASGSTGRTLYVLTAFIPTDSDSRSCLATINGASNQSVIDRVWCQRSSGNFGNGIDIVVMSQWDILHPGDANLCNLAAGVTFIQNGATYYGDPIFNGINPVDCSP